VRVPFFSGVLGAFLGFYLLLVICNLALQLGLCRLLYRRHYCGEKAEERAKIRERGRRGARSRVIEEESTEVIELIEVSHLTNIYKSVLLL